MLRRRELREEKRLRLKRDVSERRLRKGRFRLIKAIVDIRYSLDYPTPESLSIFITLNSYLAYDAITMVSTNQYQTAILPHHRIFSVMRRNNRQGPWKGVLTVDTVNSKTVIYNSLEFGALDNWRDKDIDNIHICKHG